MNLFGRCFVVALIVVNCIGFVLLDPRLRDWPTMIGLTVFLFAFELALWRGQPCGNRHREAGRPAKRYA